MSLYPMDYEEFKWALGDVTSYPQLKMLFDAIPAQLNSNASRYQVSTTILLYISDGDGEA